MKKTFIDLRSKAEDNRVIRTYTFKGDVSVIIVTLNDILIIEHEYHKEHHLKLDSGESISIRNWGENVR